MTGMEAFNDFFLQVGGSLGVGGVMLIAGIVLLVMSRKAEPQNQATMKWIGWPLVGCGGCLVVLPLIIIIAVLGLGVMLFSGQG